MNTVMNDVNLTKINQIKRFLEGAQEVQFRGKSRNERYEWIQKTLIKLGYFLLKKPEKGIVRNYLQKMSGYSRQQVTRLISHYKTNGEVGRHNYKRHRFAKIYGATDIELLANTDKLHNCLSGPATKKILEREYQVFGKAEYKNISQISIAHIYNLRQSKTYSKHHLRFTKTSPVKSKIGERSKPCPDGKPGYIRVDTCHQGDLDKKKGVYHINGVDEVTQVEVLVSVEKIDEEHMEPALEEMHEQFPFEIKEFHFDNGGEFVNYTVAELLNVLKIRFSKSRARRTNDNALVESKNGSIIRKTLGYEHIPQKYAPLINKFNRDFLNPYINFHRPCFFPKETVDAKGKRKKTYPYANMMTPYEKFKSLPNAQSFLKPNFSFDQLDALAGKLSDNESAERMVKARSDLFSQIERV